MTLIDQWEACYGPMPISGQPPPTDLDAEPSTRFRHRVAMAVSAQAVTVSLESSGTANHANRVALAHAVLNDPARYIDPFAQAMASQNMSNASTDAEIVNAVAAGWNFMAGVV